MSRRPVARPNAAIRRTKSLVSRRLVRAGGGRRRCARRRAFEPVDRCRRAGSPAATRSHSAARLTLAPGEPTATVGCAVWRAPFRPWTFCHRAEAQPLSRPRLHGRANRVTPCACAAYMENVNGSSVSALVTALVVVIAATGCDIGGTSRKASGDAGSTGAWKTPLVKEPLGYRGGQGICRRAQRTDLVPPHQYTRRNRELGARRYLDQLGQVVGGDVRRRHFSAALRGCLDAVWRANLPVPTRGYRVLVPGETVTFPRGVLRRGDTLTCLSNGLPARVRVLARGQTSARTVMTDRDGPAATAEIRVTVRPSGIVVASCR